MSLKLVYEGSPQKIVNARMQVRIDAIARAFNRLTARQNEYIDNGKTDEYIIKSTMLMVKRFSLMYTVDPQKVHSNFDFCILHMDILSNLTPRQLLNMFPVKKSWDENTFPPMNYFTTMAQFENMDMDKPMRENVFNVISNYNNDDLNKLCMAYMLSGSYEYERESGAPPLIDEIYGRNSKTKETPAIMISSENSRPRTSPRRSKKKIPSYLRLAN